jgi:hypothetical protein
MTEYVSRIVTERGKQDAEQLHTAKMGSAAKHKPSST